MATAAAREPEQGFADELIELVVRLPRETVERSILAARSESEDRSHSRLMIAKAILSGRRRRAQIFRGIQFGEPSWDMILDLYAATKEDRRIDVTSLCIASASPRTTAIRHINQLIAHGSIVRVADPNDGRRTYLVMSAMMRKTVELWLDKEIAARQIGQ